MKKRHIVISVLIILLILIIMTALCVKETGKPGFKENIRIKSPLKYDIADARRDYMLPEEKPEKGEKTGFDIMVIKLDARGNSQWSRTYGGEYYDWADHIIPVKDGGYLLAAKTYSFDEAYQGVYILKIDSKGNSTHVYRFDTPYDTTLKFPLDYGYVEAGRTYTDAGDNYGVNLTCVNPDGGYKWVKTFGNDYFEWGYTAVSTKDGHFVTTGQPDNLTDRDMEDVFVSERDKQGDYRWNKCFGGNGYDRGYSIAALKQGGYIISGLSCSYGSGCDDAYLIRLDADGNSIWAKTYGGENHDRAYAVEETQDKGFIIAGSTMSFNRDDRFEMYVIRTDADGNMKWVKTFGALKDMAAYSVAVTKDGGYVVAGASGK